MPYLDFFPRVFNKGEKRKERVGRVAVLFGELEEDMERFTCKRDTACLSLLQKRRRVRVVSALDQLDKHG